jgi:ArsR family transcriptional regulator
MIETLADAEAIFQAFGDSTRLRLINLLLDGEACVCHLCETLRASQPKVSRHLAALRRAGLVRVRRNGKWASYSVVPAQSGLPLSVMNQVRAMRADLAELSADLERMRAVRQRIACEK